MQRKSRHLMRGLNEQLSARLNTYYICLGYADCSVVSGRGLVSWMGKGQHVSLNDVKSTFPEAHLHTTINPLVVEQGYNYKVQRCSNEVLSRREKGDCSLLGLSIY